MVMHIELDNGNILFIYITTLNMVYAEFEDTKGVIRIRISKNRQHNGQTKEKE